MALVRYDEPPFLAPGALEGYGEKGSLNGKSEGLGSVLNLHQAMLCKDGCSQDVLHADRISCCYALLKHLVLFLIAGKV